MQPLRKVFKMTVVGKILADSGATFVHAHYDLMLKAAKESLAFQASQEDPCLAQIQFLDDGDSPIVLSVDTNDFSYAVNQGKKGREALKTFKESLAESYLEPFEVLEVRKNHWIKLKAEYSNIIFQINIEKSTENLEPMEWIIGRIVRFEKNPYLMQDWQKVPFRGRKGLKAFMVSNLGEADQTSAWFLANKMWLKKNGKALLDQVQALKSPV
jgi:hypothetical protein